jgi:hypothetical protein
MAVRPQNNKLDAEKKEEGKEKKRKILRGLSGNHVDCVSEGVHASYVLIDIDGDSDCL